MPVTDMPNFHRARMEMLAMSNLKDVDRKIAKAREDAILRGISPPPPTWADVEALDAERERLAKALQWIAVSDRLPELHRDVLATGYNFGNPERGRWFNVLRRANERSDIGWEAVGIGPCTPPTHWMPLPEAPCDHSYRALGGACATCGQIEKP